MMKNKYITVVLAILAVTQSLALEESEIQISNANSKFTSSLYEALTSGDGNKDVFFSPLGIHTVLSMLYQGADGTTKDALASSLHLPEPATVAEGYSHILLHLTNLPNVTLHIANKAYIKDQFELLPEYDNIVRDRFQTELEGVDFEENQGNAAADTINSWVNEKTNGKINQLFEAKDFDVYTRLVLVNAIYFKGDWKNQFEKSFTRTEPFYVDNNEKINVQMMHKIQDGLRYKQDFDIMAQVLELPFSGDNVTLTIALPMDRNGIKNLEEKIAAYGVDTIFQNMFPAGDIDIRIPKFKLETKIDLKDPLTKLGLGIIFEKENSNFLNLAKLVPNENLYVTKAIQKAFIEVNEEGAEAAAATGAAVGVAYSAPLQREQFYANHPFMVILKEGDNILFYGKIMRPVSGDSEIAPTEEELLETNRRKFSGEGTPLYNPFPSSDRNNVFNQDQFGPPDRAQDRSWYPKPFNHDPSDPYYNNYYNNGNRHQSSHVPDASTWYPRAGPAPAVESDTTDKYDRIHW